MNIVELKERLLQIDLYEFDNFKLDNATTIVNAKRFVDSHIIILEANRGNRTFVPYYNRLLKFYILISE